MLTNYETSAVREGASCFPRFALAVFASVNNDNDGGHIFLFEKKYVFPTLQVLVTTVVRARIYVHTMFCCWSTPSYALNFTVLIGGTPSIDWRPLCCLTWVTVALCSHFSIPMSTPGSRSCPKAFSKNSTEVEPEASAGTGSREIPLQQVNGGPHTSVLQRLEELSRVRLRAITAETELSRVRLRAISAKAVGALKTVAGQPSRLLV